jgi:acetyl-CoA hydrolase
MQDYFDRAKAECLPRGMGHQPHLLFSAYQMQRNLIENGTMKIDRWDSACRDATEAARVALAEAVG